MEEEQKNGTKVQSIRQRYQNISAEHLIRRNTFNQADAEGKNELMAEWMWLLDAAFEHMRTNGSYKKFEEFNEKINEEIEKDK